MKKFKKIFAAIAASALVAAMSFTSMAASITISRGDNFETGGENSTEETYTYYKVLSAIKTSKNLGNTTDGNVGGETEEIKGVSYQIKADDPWFDVLNGNTQVKEYLKLTQSADKTVYVVEWNESKENNETNAINLANLLKDHLNDDAIKNTGMTFKTGETKTVTDGYYLITSSLGTNLILATSDITIKEKNVYPTITKFVDGNKSLADHNIGDMVPYTLTVTVPENVVTDNEHQIVINDTMAKGFLKFKDVVTAVDSTNSAFNAFETTKISDNEFKITLKNLSEAKGKTITFTYTAELLADAVANTEYANEATLSYSNYVTPKKIANVKTFAFTLKKVNEDGNELGGAMFELRAVADDSSSAIKFVADAEKKNYVKADSTATGSATIEAGTVNVRGIKSGTYYLVETTAPQGYNVLDHAVEVKINDEGNILDKENNPLASNIVVVENKKGLMLPSTGGMGTVAFAVVGLIVMAGAAVTLIIKKRA